jgi:hypothetical protein
MYNRRPLAILACVGIGAVGYILACVTHDVLALALIFMGIGGVIALA